MKVEGIPFKISIPSSQEVSAVTIDNIPVKYHVETSGDLKIVTVFENLKNS